MNRRNFLGLLAAAPLAPAIAKAAAEPQLISGMAMASEKIVNIDLCASQWSAGYNHIRFKEWSRVSHTLDFDTGEISVTHFPNRLHGVAVNADGDAI